MMKPLGGSGVEDLQEKKSAFIFNRELECKQYMVPL